MSQSPEPLVSVLMASFDSASFIEEGIESALGQSYEHLEVLVADDRSSDETMEIVERCARRDPRVVPIRGSENVGAWRNRNRAFQRSKGELLAQLDPDDLWMPDKIARQVEVMRSRPEVGLVYTAFEQFASGSGERIGEPARADREGDVFGPLWTEWNFIGALTAIWRRSAMERRGVELWSCEPHAGDDYNLWLLISMDWQVAGIDEVLARYRRHGSNLTDRGGNPHLVYLRLLRRFAADYPEVNERLGARKRVRFAREYRQAASYEAEGGHRLRAARRWLTGFALDPAAVLRPRRQRLRIRAGALCRRLAPWRRNGGAAPPGG